MFLHKNSEKYGYNNSNKGRAYMQQTSKFGIYLNTTDKLVVRINSPYWIPEEPDWVYLTPEVNATLLSIRDMVRETSLVPDADGVTWGNIPAKD